MRQLEITVDCDEKTCGECGFQKYTPSTGRESCQFPWDADWNDTWLDKVQKGQTVHVLRCSQCLAAERKAHER